MRFRREVETELTSLMSWKAGASTTLGFRAWEKMRHSEVTMNKTDATMEKNNCSNCMLRLKPS